MSIWFLYLLPFLFCCLYLWEWRVKVLQVWPTTSPTGIRTMPCLRLSSFQSMKEAIVRLSRNVAARAEDRVVTTWRLMTTAQSVAARLPEADVEDRVHPIALAVGPDHVVPSTTILAATAT